MQVCAAECPVTIVQDKNINKINGARLLATKALLVCQANGVWSKGLESFALSYHKTTGHALIFRQVSLPDIQYWMC